MTSKTNQKVQRKFSFGAIDIFSGSFFHFLMIVNMNLEINYEKKNNLLITVTQTANMLGYSLQPFNPKSSELRKMKN